MTDDRLERAMREMAEHYNAPPATPREEMWSAIEDARRVRAAERRGYAALLRIHPALRWGIGIAAVLAIGVGIGRLSGPTRAPVTEPPVAENGASAAGVYRWATVQHLDRVETYLALFQQDARAQRADHVSEEGARDLLSTTRLLLDSPAADDATFRRLLEDLELVLAQISQFLEQRQGGELDLIDDSIRRRGVMLRLQTVVGSADGAL